MSVNVFDHVHGAVHRGGVFDVGAPPAKIPGSIDGFLQQHGINAANMLATRQKFSVAQIDQHLSGRNLKPADRMAVKSCLAQIGLLT